ncbi:MAG: hypothetical protein KAT12_07735 [Gammaproteobacteria bacterium]|nr:hypothetical protein [Gammaproteobacteria bacterium]
MSLLLDALKKAADDKQKVSQGSSHEPAPVTDSPAEAAPNTDAAAETIASPPATEIAQKVTDDVAAELPKNVEQRAEELTLDSIEPVTETVKAEETAPVLEIESVSSEADEVTLDQKKSRKDPDAGNYTVSDEALSMLIYKTNHDAKRDRRLLLGSVLLLSLAILVSGGFYYYMDMQEEIAVLERKHQIAMQSMRLKTNKESTPDKSEIIRNLVGDSGLDDKVQYAKKQMAEEREMRKAVRRPVTAASNAGATGTVSSTVSFQKTNKVDPVAVRLEEAWSAYEDARYDQASKLYKEVLTVEGNNRDALLGLGAIAIVEKNKAMAKDIYITLLKLDPRDPIAIAALASLRDNEVPVEADEKYLLSMLQKNQDDAHLNFALGNLYAQQEKWKQAQQSYFNAWQRDNENADYIFNLAVSMDQLGKHKQAATFYRDCLKKSGNKQVAFSREAVQKRIDELSGI